MGRDLDCMADVLMGFHSSSFSKPNTDFNSYLAPCDFLAFLAMKRELRGKKFRSDQRSAARFREVHRLPREVLRKRDRHHISTKFRFRVIRRVHELCKRPPTNLENYSYTKLSRLTKFHFEVENTRIYFTQLPHCYSYLWQKLS
jgi:hypothetical protein